MILCSLRQKRMKIFLFLMIYLPLTLQHISYTWLNSVSTNYLTTDFVLMILHACISFYFNHLAIMVTFTIQMGGLQACTAKSVDKLIHISGFLKASYPSPFRWCTRCEVHHQPTLLIADGCCRHQHFMFSLNFLTEHYLIHPKFIFLALFYN